MDKIEFSELDFASLRKLKNEMTISLNEVQSTIGELTLDEKVRKYIESVKLRDTILENLPNIELELKRKTMLSCKHIWVKTSIEREYDGHRDEKREYYTCVKCGLDTKAVERAKSEISKVSELDRVMEDVFNINRSGEIINFLCEKNLAIRVYNIIRIANPNISDEEGVRYFMHALYAFKNNNVNNRQKRIKRLGLNPVFYK